MLVKLTATAQSLSEDQNIEIILTHPLVDHQINLNRY